MVSELAQPLSQDGLHRRVADTLRQQIARGLLSPGERLREMHIARQMGVSQTPVREALRLLEREGLVTHRPRRGVYVIQLLPRDVDEIYSLRCALESLAIRRALLFMTPYDLRAIERIVVEMETAAEVGDVDGLVTCAARFHEAICVLSRHDRLLTTWRQVVAQTSHIGAVAGQLYVDHLPAEAAYHRAVLDALRTGDPDVAELAIKGHFQQAGHQLLRTAMERGLFGTDEEPARLRTSQADEWAIFLEPERPARSHHS